MLMPHVLQLGFVGEQSHEWVVIYIARSIEDIGRVLGRFWLLPRRNHHLEFGGSLCLLFIFYYESLNHVAF